MTCKLKLHSVAGSVRQTHFFIIFCTFVFKNLSSYGLKFLGKIAGKYVGNLKQASGAQVRAPKKLSVESFTV